MIWNITKQYVTIIDHRPSYSWFYFYSIHREPPSRSSDTYLDFPERLRQSSPDFRVPIKTPLDFLNSHPLFHKPLWLRYHCTFYPLHGLFIPLDRFVYRSVSYFSWGTDEKRRTLCYTLLSTYFFSLTYISSTLIKSKGLREVPLLTKSLCFTEVTFSG